jgi:hypothetical protein
MIFDSSGFITVSALEGIPVIVDKVPPAMPMRMTLQIIAI